MPQQMIQGSLEPGLRVTLTDNADPVDLSTAEAVAVRVEVHGLAVIDATLAGPYSTTGVVTRDWQTGETDTPGRYWIAVCVTWPGGRRQWFEPADVLDVVPV